MVPNGTRAPGDKRPNFVFYFPDTIAAESCGGEYGNPVTETPFMDALAKEGTLFKQAHVLHTQCAPSRHAIVTGRYMHTTGHRTQSHGVEVRKRHFLSHLYIKCIIYQDRLGTIIGKTQKKGRFLAGVGARHLQVPTPSSESTCLSSMQSFCLGRFGLLWLLLSN